MRQGIGQSIKNSDVLQSWQKFYRYVKLRIRDSGGTPRDSKPQELLRIPDTSIPGPADSRLFQNKCASDCLCLSQIPLDIL